MGRTDQRLGGYHTKYPQSTTTRIPALRSGKTTIKIVETDVLGAESNTFSEAEIWFDVPEMIMDTDEILAEGTDWENFPEIKVLFENPEVPMESKEAILASHEMEQQFLAERWKEVHFIF